MTDESAAAAEFDRIVTSLRLNLETLTDERLTPEQRESVGRHATANLAELHDLFDRLVRSGGSRG